MANLRTLKPFAKGHDSRRNLKGRPKGKVSRLEDLYIKALEQKVFAYGQEMTNEEAIIMKLIDDARKGNISAFKLYMKYRHGNPINFCPNCNYTSSRRAKKEIEEAERRDEEERRRKAWITKAKEIEEWQSRWFPKESKGKKK